MNAEYTKKWEKLASQFKQYKADKKRGWRIIQVKRGRKVIELL